MRKVLHLQHTPCLEDLFALLQRQLPLSAFYVCRPCCDPLSCASFFVLHPYPCIKRTTITIAMAGQSNRAACHQAWAFAEADEAPCVHQADDEPKGIPAPTSCSSSLSAVASSSPSFPASTSATSHAASLHSIITSSPALSLRACYLRYQDPT